MLVCLFVCFVRLTHLLVCLFVDSLTHSLVCLFCKTHSLTCLFVCLFDIVFWGQRLVFVVYIYSVILEVYGQLFVHSRSSLG